MSLRERYAEFKKGMKPTIKEFKFTLKKVRESPLSLVGLSLVAFFVAISVLAPVLAPPKEKDPFMIPYGGGWNLEPLPPSFAHPFGTGSTQIDIYYGCIWGTIYAFRLGLIVIASTLVIGLILGLVAGYYGGIIDELIMRFTDIIIAFPGLILTMALIVALAQRNIERMDAAIIGIIIVGWPGYTRLIRGEVLRVKTEDYIEAAKASGASDFRIIMRHILPNSIYPIVIVASLDFGTIVLFAAALSFLGLGAPARYSDWGQLIQAAGNWVSYGLRYWWTFVFPGLFITLFCLGWNLLGDAFRDILDPLYRRK
jgi:peptide/nickel transport system permease protein